MSESSIYDYGLAAIPILETELLKERSEHQEFRAQVAAALRKLQTETIAAQKLSPEESGWQDGLSYIDVRIDATITELGLSVIPDCPDCGNNRQVWVNQISGKMTCHRAGCHKEASK